MEAIRKKSMRGSLKRYANPALMDPEQDAWQMSAGETESISSKAMQPRHDNDNPVNSSRKFP